MKRLKLGLAIGCGIGGIVLLYLGMQLVNLNGFALWPGLTTLVGLSLVLLSVMYFKEVEGMEYGTALPKPPAVVQKPAASAKAAPAKKTRKTGKKKGRK